MWLWFGRRFLCSVDEWKPHVDTLHPPFLCLVPVFGEKVTQKRRVVRSVCGWFVKKKHTWGRDVHGDVGWSGSQRRGYGYGYAKWNLCGIDLYSWWSERETQRLNPSTDNCRNTKYNNCDAEWSIENCIKSRISIKLPEQFHQRFFVRISMFVARCDFSVLCTNSVDQCFVLSPFLCRHTSCHCFMLVEPKQNGPCLIIQLFSWPKVVWFHKKESENQEQLVSRHHCHNRGTEAMTIFRQGSAAMTAHKNVRLVFRPSSCGILLSGTI